MKLKRKVKLNAVCYKVPNIDLVQRGRLDDAIKAYNESHIPDNLRQAA